MSKRAYFVILDIKATPNDVEYLLKKGFKRSEFMPDIFLGSLEEEEKLSLLKEIPVKEIVDDISFSPFKKEL